MRRMLQFRFVAYLVVMCEVHTANKVFSKLMQSDSSLVLDVPNFVADYKTGVQSLRVLLGPESKRRLPFLKQG